MDTVIDLVRNPIKSGMSKLAGTINAVSGGRIKPATITLVGLLAHVGIAILIAKDHFVIAALLLIFFGLFDALDGALARLQKADSPKGMLLDSITDRLKEPMIFTAFAYSFVAADKPYLAIWVVPACGVSILISYVNAWGEVVTKDQKTTTATNKKFRGGFMTFEVRIAMIVLGLLLNQIFVTVVLITVLGAITAMQRFRLIMQKL